MFVVCCVDVRYTSERISDRVPNPEFSKILEDLPKKPPRSRLEPYRELIFELRRRNRTFREIAQVLGEKCAVSVVASTVYDFVNAASLTKEIDDTGSVTHSPEQRRTGRRNKVPQTNLDETERRIAELKARKIDPQPSPNKFQFVSGEPLRLPKAREK